MKRRLPDEHALRAILAGERKGAVAGIARAMLAIIEPAYAGITAARNALYNRGILPAHRVGCAVIGIGNLTTGGTGKTPTVRWLAETLRDAGLGVAIVGRGYRARPGTLGDEQLMLQRLLNRAGKPPIAVRSNPDRVAAVAELLRERAGGLDVVLLDDAFQHRRIARDLDIVLLSATNPFGFGHVLPRGLMREPASGLSRAGAIVITHSDAVASADLAAIEERVRRYNASAPIFRAIHAPAGLREPAALCGTAEGSADDLAHPVGALRDKRVFSFCGIAHPELWHRGLLALGITDAGHAWFADHHDYTAAELADLRSRANSVAADLLLTTEKDWAKIERLWPSDAQPPLWRTDVELRFERDGEAGLAELALQRIRDYGSVQKAKTSR